ncbi:SDR family NAD(P)-dependent oxidoreductase [Halobium salinum]|uniref:SDR family NAD(P)-dependent oxidoreductase n=1 Tax=Halobium salinum TaxID=1364940 RepID=A0ABD5PGZ6_9EURY|nr:glucose 1-dehydrogenase [Halobium salinum]
MNGIDGTVALVTGAGSGIGREIARRFASEGAKVCCVDVDETGGAETVDRIEEVGGEAVFVAADVSDEDAVADAVAAAVDAFGGLDFVVNNAGVEGTNAPTGEQTAADWARVLGVNLSGVFYGTKHALPHLLERGGAVVNVASVAGLVGFEGIAPYVASKHGVVGLTRTTALEYATEGVRVNAVCPGVVDTPMVERYGGGDEAAAEAMTQLEPVGRMADPAEIAASVVWLCSDDASFVTGAAIPVDGGLTAR